MEVKEKGISKKKKQKKQKSIYFALKDVFEHTSI